MKIKPDKNCTSCRGTGIVVDWVPYGSTEAAMETLCDCVIEQTPEDFEGEVEIEEHDLIPPMPESPSAKDIFPDALSLDDIRRELGE